MLINDISKEWPCRLTVYVATDPMPAFEHPVGCIWAAEDAHDVRL